MTRGNLVQPNAGGPAIDVSLHAGLVHQQAKRAHKHFGGMCQLDDLVQAAWFGVFRAAQKFEHERGLRFSTYAIPWIRASIRRHVHNHRCTVRTPIHRLEKLRARREALPPVAHSLDRKIGDEDGRTFGDMLPDTANDPELALAEQDDESDLHAAIAALPERLRAIVRGRLDGKTLDVIGAEIGGLSRERVRQLESMAIEAIREELRGDPWLAREKYRRLHEGEARSAAQRAAA